MACAGLARAEMLAELLPTLDLARLCSASIRFYSQAAALARAAIRAHHGLMILDASLAEIHSLDCLPEVLDFDLREQGTRRVLRGNPLCTTYVGSYTDRVTLAQIPPASGDAWSIDCSLRRGAYLMTLEGWENPSGWHHQRQPFMRWQQEEGIRIIQSSGKPWKPWRWILWLLMQDQDSRT